MPIDCRLYAHTDIIVKFANKLKNIREERNLSQEQLALLCGIDRTYIGRLERMERNPSLIILDKLADGLGIKITELLDI